MKLFLRVENLIAESLNIPRYSKSEIKDILGSNENILSLFKIGRLNTEIVIADNKQVYRYAGLSVRPNRDIAHLLDYIYMGCLEKANHFKCMDVLGMTIFQMSSGELGVTVKFVDSPDVSIFFEKINGVYKYKTSFNYKIGLYDHGDLENLLTMALDSSFKTIPGKSVPIRSIGYWLKKPLTKENKTSLLGIAYVGYCASRDVVGEYDVVYYVE